MQNVDDPKGINISQDREDTRNELGDIVVSWTKPPTLMDMKKDLEDARQFQQVEVGKIKNWLDHYHMTGNAKPKTKEGFSKIAPKLVRKHAEWRYSALSEPFLSTDNIFTAEPVTYEDIKASEQNMLLLNHQFNKKINKNAFIDEYVRAAVDEGTVITKTSWKYKDKQVIDKLPELTYIENPSFAQVISEALEVQATNPAQYEQEIPYDIKQAVIKSQEFGVPVEAVRTGNTVEVPRTVIIANHPELEICNAENFYIDPTCNGDIDKANFATHSFESNKATLQLQPNRYFNLNNINSDSNSVLGEPDHAVSGGSADFNFKDEARKKFVVYEYWAFIDVEGDGVLVPIVAAWVGNTIVRMELNPFPDEKLPFDITQYMPVRKSVYGEPDGELLMDNQAVIGAVTRGMIDVMARGANGQVGTANGWLDAVNKKKFKEGSDYEYNPTMNPLEGIYMHKYDDIPSSAQYMMELQNNEAQSMTGIVAFGSGGLSGNALGDTATGVRGTLDAASKRELGILRRLAAGIVRIGIKITSMNGEFVSEVETIRVTNTQFVPVRKDELRGDFDIKLSVSTAEEDNAKAEEISFQLQTMGPNLDFNITKQLMAKQFALRKMPDLAKQILDYEPEPDPLEVAIKEAELEKLKAHTAYFLSQTNEKDAEALLDQTKVGTEIAKAANLEADTDLKSLEFVETEQGVTHERNIEKIQSQAEGNAALEIVKSKVTPKSTPTKGK